MSHSADLPPDVEARLQELEATVARQGLELRELKQALLSQPSIPDSVAPRTALTPPPPRPAMPTPASVQRPTPPRPEPKPPNPAKPQSGANDWVNSWEFWLNRFGIGMLLLGVAFLFKYALDQGWLTAFLLVGIGYLIAGFLGFLGWRLRQTRVTFSQVLVGGGIGTGYITTFAAFQGFQIFSYPLAFALMVVITVGAFFISLRQQKAVMSVIGATGGLATPFLLAQGDANTIGLVVYTLLILGSSLAIYRAQAWISLYGTTYFLGILVFLVAIFANPTLGSPVTLSPERLVLQAGILGLTLGYGLLPLSFQPRPTAILEIIAVLNPFVLLSYSAGTWKWLAPGVGWLALGLAVLYGGATLVPKTYPAWRGVWRLAAALLALAAMLLHLSHREIIFIPLTGEAILLLWLGQKYRSTTLSTLGHIFWGVLAASLVGRLLFFTDGSVVALDAPSLINLGMIAGLGYTAWLLRVSPVRWLYAVGTYIGFLLWTQQEFNPVGSGLVTLLWGCYGIGLLLVGLRWDIATARLAALITLIVCGLKLFLWDLMGVEAIWRVLLFMAFGSVFLVLSYYFRSLWRPSSAQAPSPVLNPENDNDAASPP